MGHGGVRRGTSVGTENVGGGTRGTAGGVARTQDENDGHGPYLVIDLKSFYASVECVERGLDPFSANLVVADPTRSPNTICLAVSPALKAQGVKNRCRLRDIPPGITYVAAMPQMHRYLEVSSQIYGIYLRFFSARDAWPYSVDEAFFDMGPYLALYGANVRATALRIMGEVYRQTGITATAGIGTNMFLAKVALDLMAKHADDGIGMLDEQGFRRDVWFHHPIRDIWGIGPGIARRLARHGVTDLAGICASDPAWLYKEFGKGAEWLIDHAWGLEPCTIAQARGYVPKARSISNGQVLMRDYGTAETRVVLREMVWQSCLDLAVHGLVCQTVGVWVGYARPEEAPGGSAQRKLSQPTSHEARIARAALELFDSLALPGRAIRRIGFYLGGVMPAEETAPTLFDSPGQDGREERLARAVEAARERFGPNAVLTATSLRPEANGLERNLQIGGHHA